MKQKDFKLPSYNDFIKQAQKSLDNKDADIAVNIIKWIASEHNLECEDLAWAYAKEGNYTDKEIQELINYADEEYQEEWNRKVEHAEAMDYVATEER